MLQRLSRSPSSNQNFLLPSVLLPLLLHELTPTARPSWPLHLAGVLCPVGTGPAASSLQDQNSLRLQKYDGTCLIPVKLRKLKLRCKPSSVRLSYLRSSCADGYRRERNAKSSSFLRLPNEIRNNIYEHLFCGKNIHVFIAEEPHPWFKTVRHAVCGASSAAATRVEAAKPGQSKPQGLLRTDMRPVFHDSDNSLTYRETLPVGLLRTCRQIHCDAALLPFERNTFCFQHIHEVIFFLQKLATEQSGRIENIVLDYLRGKSVSEFFAAALPPDPNVRNPASWRAILKEGLPGVRHIYVQYAVTRGWVPSSFGILLMLDILPQVNNLLDLGVLALDTVIVRLHEQIYGFGPPRKRWQQNWEDMIEQKLLTNPRRSERVSVRNSGKRRHDEELWIELKRLRKSFV